MKNLDFKYYEKLSNQVNSNILKIEEENSNFSEEISKIEKFDFFIILKDFENYKTR